MSEQGPGGVTVDIRDDDGRLLVKLAGELDLTNIELLERPMARYLAQGTAEEIIFEMSGLGFMDSTAIAVLLKVAGSGKSVRLRNPSSIVQEVLQAMGLTSVLQVEP